MYTHTLLFGTFGSFNIKKKALLALMWALG